ncbi:S1 RNA-binding domain-containing protein [Candidatus Parcubacteria bacterium]|nr:S1 RNA-binding domain-containing protein [Candidatus Parcubacteria bacterium]
MAEAFIKLPIAQVLPQIGTVLQGTVIEKAPASIYVDLGLLGTGIVYGREYLDAIGVARKMKVGDRIYAKVIEIENEDGYVELSLREAGREKTWERFNRLKEEGEVVSVKIIEANRGGLIAEVEGVKAFLPVSQLSSEHYPRVEGGDKQKIYLELQKFVGSDLHVKVLDVDPREDKLILSEKEIEAKEVRELLSHWHVGDVVAGEVSGVVDFGAFIKFRVDPADENAPLVEGLVHISELDHKLIDDPRTIVKIGDKIKAVIIGLEGGRVSFSLKRLKEDPWKAATSKYQKGDEVQGEITKLNPYGAFVRLDEHIHGLAHVSQFGSENDMRRALVIGKNYQFRITDLKPEEHRLALTPVTPEESSSPAPAPETPATPTEDHA